LLLEELVNRVADAVAQASHGAEGVRARPKVRDGAQELEGGAFLLDGIGVGIAPAVDDDTGRLDFGRLALRGGFQHFAFDGDAAADVELFDFAFVVREIRVGDDLNIAEAGAVIEFDEAEAAFGVAAGADPALQANLLADRFLLTSDGDGCPVHGILLT